MICKTAEGIVSMFESKVEKPRRFNVRERKLRRDAPILIRNDEDLPVSYELEYDGRICPQHARMIKY